MSKEVDVQDQSDLVFVLFDAKTIKIVWDQNYAYKELLLLNNMMNKKLILNIKVFKWMWKNVSGSGIIFSKMSQIKW
jgi:hypothetical protein